MIPIAASTRFELRMKRTTMSNAALAADRFASAGNACKYASRPINSANPSTSEAMATPIPQRIRALRRSPASQMPAAANTIARIGRTIASLSSSLTPACAFFRPSASKSSNCSDSLPIGSLSKIPMPRSESCDRSSTTSAERSSTTSPFFVLMTLPLPVSALTTCSWALRFASSQSSWNCLDWKNCSVTRSVNSSERGRERPGEEGGSRRKHVFRGRLDVDVVEQRVRDPHRDCAARSRRSRASGATVATYSSVSSTWLCAHTATTDNGTRMQLRTISTIERMRRQRGLPPALRRRRFGRGRLGRRRGCGHASF